jgi:glucose/mannose transport system permease protein
LIRRSAAKAFYGRSISIHWLSFIVTGTAWKLFLDPRIGLENAMHDWGWTSFHFDWVVNPNMMIVRCYSWHLAKLRARDGDVSGRSPRSGWRDIEGGADRWCVGLPDLPKFRSSRILFRIDRAGPHGIKSYDLVLSVTGKNPGGAAELPSTFMYSYTFTRNQMAVGSASAVIMLMTIAAIMVPYIYSETRETNR